MVPLFSDIFLGLYYLPRQLSTKNFTAILSIVKFSAILQDMSFGHTAVRITQNNYSSRDSAKYYILCTTEKITIHRNKKNLYFTFFYDYILINFCNYSHECKFTSPKKDHQL